VRHPIYTGFIVIYVALAILCGSALALADAALMTVGLWIKARLEEQFLSEELEPRPMTATRPERQRLCLA
jgi:protein-S-isoprenylcysteine O-methyltransferase Ste14